MIWHYLTDDDVNVDLENNLFLIKLSNLATLFMKDYFQKSLPNLYS
jgi:hypothetical protein